jgi:hypothetical protein
VGGAIGDKSVLGHVGNNPSKLIIDVLDVQANCKIVLIIQAVNTDLAVTHAISCITSPISPLFASFAVEHAVSKLFEIVG